MPIITPNITDVVELKFWIKKLYAIIEPMTNIINELTNVILVNQFKSLNCENGMFNTEPKPVFWNCGINITPNNVIAIIPNTINEIQFIVFDFFFAILFIYYYWLNW